MSFLPGMRAGVGLIKPVLVVHNDIQYTGVDNQSSYSFSVGIGAAHASRFVVAMIFGGHLTANLANVHSCTIDGSAATWLEGSPVGGTSGSSYQLWARAVPSGTTTTIAFSRAANMDAGVLWCASVYFAKSMTPVDTIWNGSSGDVDVSMNTLSKSGSYITARGLNVSGITLAAVNFTEDENFSAEGGDLKLLAGHYHALAPETPRSMTVDASTSFTSAIGATWR